MVRTDSKDQKLEAFFKPTNQDSPSISANEVPEKETADSAAVNTWNPNVASTSRQEGTNVDIEEASSRTKQRYSRLKVTRQTCRFPKFCYLGSFK